VRGRGGLAHAIRWRLVNSGAVAPVPIARGKTLRPQVNVRVTGLSVDGRLGVPLEGDDDPGAARFSFSAGRPLSLRPPIKQEPRLSQAAGVPRRPDRRGGVQTLHQWRLFNSGAAPRFLHHPNGAMLSASTSWVLLRRSVAVLGGAFLRGLIA
jgi:hypothetical protein